jgi:hypothetical protein
MAARLGDTIVSLSVGLMSSWLFSFRSFAPRDLSDMEGGDIGLFKVEGIIAMVIV